MRLALRKVMCLKNPALLYQLTNSLLYTALYLRPMKTLSFGDSLSPRKSLLQAFCFLCSLFFQQHLLDVGEDESLETQNLEYGSVFH